MTHIAELEREYADALGSVARTIGVDEGSSGADTAQRMESMTARLLHPSNTWFVSGISGSGKSTVVHALRERGYARIPNVVTRPRRPEESEHENVFVTEAEFDRMEAAGSLFHPHMTNGVRHAMRISDITSMTEGARPSYLDKSVPSVIDLIRAYPRLGTNTFVYLLPPSFEELYRRISERESQPGREHALTEEQLADRFEEEIVQMRLSTGAPYAYVLNDSIERVRSLILTHLPQDS